MNIAAFIHNIPLFKGLPREQLNRLAAIAVEKSFGKGEVVFREGYEANGFYVSVRGRVKIFKVAPDGKEQILHIVGFQEPFGEVPVFSGGRFPANAQTIDDTLLVFFPRLAFVNLISNDPSLAMNMLGILSSRLRQFAGLVEQLSLKDVPARLSSYLIYLSDRSNNERQIELDIPKTLLAHLLGTIPETISRVLSKLAGEGILVVKGRNIVLLDREKLQHIASGTVTL
jgi:CRP/FNR family transcriptional regulator, dissimilatory nitrate respiration regulator